MEQPRDLNEEEEDQKKSALKVEICPENHPEKKQLQEGQRDQEVKDQGEQILKEFEYDTLGNIKKIQELKLQDQQSEEKEKEESVKETEETVKETEETAKETEESVKKTEETVKETEESVKETEESVKETEETARETEETAKETEETVKETEESVKETEETVKETEESVKETEETVKETKETVKETEETVKETEETAKEKEEGLKEDQQSRAEELPVQTLEEEQAISEDMPQVEQLQQKSPPENQEQLTEDPKDDEAATDSPEDHTEEPEPTEETQENLQKMNQKSLVANTKLGPEGEEDLPNEQVTQFLRHLVTQLWPELGPSPELRLERASAKGDNYLGVVWRLQVAASESNYSLVVKLPPQNRVRRKQFFARPCFLRETAAYEIFLPLAEKLQEKWKVPGEDRFRQHARCFGTRQDEPNECIVLEDLSSSGFILHNRFLDLPPDHVRHVIRSYAKLHAVSLAGKRQFPERMLQLQQLVDIFEQRREDHALGVYFENLKGSALSSLTSPGDDPYRVRLEAYFSRGSYFSLLLPLVSGSNCEPFAVICHGDCWNNNILYQGGGGGGGGGELKDVRLIDWQLMRYASPVTDLAYFLFTCTSRGFRQRYLKEILEEYYEELGQHLSRLGEQLELLMPRSAFEQQVATKAAVGLLLAMMVLPIVTMQGKDVPDLQAISERIEAGATTDLQGAGFLGAGNEATFKQRMREVILDCVDFNYI